MTPPATRSASPYRVQCRPIVARTVTFACAACGHTAQVREPRGFTFEALEVARCPACRNVHWGPRLRTLGRALVRSLVWVLFAMAAGTCPMSRRFPGGTLSVSATEHAVAHAAAAARAEALWTYGLPVLLVVVFGSVWWRWNALFPMGYRVEGAGSPPG